MATVEVALWRLFQWNLSGSDDETTTMKKVNLGKVKICFSGWQAVDDDVVGQHERTRRCCGRCWLCEY